MEISKIPRPPSPEDSFKTELQEAIENRVKTEMAASSDGAYDWTAIEGKVVREVTALVPGRNREVRDATRQIIATMQSQL